MLRDDIHEEGLLLVLYKISDLKEVNLLVARPDESRVNVVGDALEALLYLLGVPVVHVLVRETPIPVWIHNERLRPRKQNRNGILGSFEEVSLAVGPREGGVEVGRQPVPVPRDASGVAVRNGLVGQTPILHAFKIIKSFHVQADQINLGPELDGL